MTRFPDMMCDLETMGGPPDGALVGIGVVAFNFVEGTIGPQFYRAVHLASSVEAGMKIDPATVIFWLRQSKDAQSAISTNLEPLTKTLEEFSGFVQRTGTHDVRMWGNGPAFDNAILSTAYKLTGLTSPWDYWNDRCFRTISNQYRAVPYDTSEKRGVAHNAIDDCKFQIAHLMKIRDYARAKNTRSD